MRSTVALDSLSAALLTTFYRDMRLIRKAEEAIVALYPEQEIRCPTHLSIGQEAVAVGVCQALTRADAVFSGHRCHAHYLAKGGSLRAMFAELYGKATGCCAGKGGSMHLAAPEVGMLGASAIVAGTIPLAVGRALAAVFQATGDVSVAFFGDAAVEQGVAHESFSFAALKRLPVLFVCENNLYATFSPLAARQVCTNIAPRAGAYQIPGISVDGNDVVQVHLAAKAAVERARRGDGPSFIEAKTYRWRGHVGPTDDGDIGYRSRSELAEWVARDPLATHASRLEELGVLTAADRAAIDAGIDEDIARAVEFAKTSAFPALTDLHTETD